MAILFTFGISDLGTSQIRPDPQGNMNIFADGCCSIMGLVDLGDIQQIPFLLYGSNAEQPPVRLPVKPTLIFNQIAEPDSHSTALQRCVTLCDALKLPVINDPRKVQQNSRDQVSELLQGIDGVTMPRTYRVAPASPEEVMQAAREKGLEFPFIFRTTGQHNGEDMVRIDGPDQLDRLHAFAFDGREHYLIEFVDYADSNGVYYKYRIVVVNGEQYAQHVSFNQGWMVHVLARGGLKFQQEHPEFGVPAQLMQSFETEVLPKTADSVKTIWQRIGLDYFAIDCHVNSDGHILVFEANANLHALENPQAGTEPFIEKIRHALRQLIIDRSGAESGP